MCSFLVMSLSTLASGHLQEGPGDTDSLLQSASQEVGFLSFLLLVISPSPEAHDTIPGFPEVNPVPRCGRSSFHKSPDMN